MKSSSYLAAVQKMQRALFEFYIRGVKTNIAFLDNVLRHREFLSGQATTSFIERTPELFEFGSRNSQKSSKLLMYLANMVGSFLATTAWTRLCCVCRLGARPARFLQA